MSDNVPLVDVVNIWEVACRRKDAFVAVAVDIIRFQSYGLQDNVALLVLLHRKSKPLNCCFLFKQGSFTSLGCTWLHMYVYILYMY